MKNPAPVKLWRNHLFCDIIICSEYNRLGWKTWLVNVGLFLCWKLLAGRKNYIRSPFSQWMIGCPIGLFSVFLWFYYAWKNFHIFSDLYWAGIQNTSKTFLCFFFVVVPQPTTLPPPWQHHLPSFRVPLLHSGYFDGTVHHSLPFT